MESTLNERGAIDQWLAIRWAQKYSRAPQFNPDGSVNQQFAYAVARVLNPSGGGTVVRENVSDVVARYREAEDATPNPNQPYRGWLQSYTDWFNSSEDRRKWTLVAGTGVYVTKSLAGMSNAEIANQSDGALVKEAVVTSTVVVLTPIALEELAAEMCAPDVLMGDLEGGAVVDGAVVDGAVVDGAVVDGAVVDGAVVDGAVADGAVVDGAVADGAVADGAAEEAIAPIAPSNPIAQGVTEAPTAGGAGTTNPNYRNLTFQELEQKIFRGQKWFTWE